MHPEPGPAALLLALLAATCAPAPTPPSPGDRVVSHAGTYVLVIQPPVEDCLIGEPCALQVQVERADGAALPQGLRLEVDAAMPDHRHGLNATPAVQREGEGLYRVEGLLLHMPGYWEVAFDFTAGPVTERAQVVHDR